MHKPTDESTVVRSALRALDVLECFTPANPERSLSELARETGLAVSTTSRLLTTLVSAGYLRKSSNGLFRFDARMIKIAVAGLNGLSIYEIAGRHLTAMRDKTGETANLAVPSSEGRAVYARQAESNRSIQHKVWLGETLPAEGTAIGSAIMGHVDETGYVVRKGSVEPDVVAIAAPVRDRSGAIIGAFSITMPLYRLVDDMADEYGRIVCDHATQASAELGWQSPDLPRQSAG